MDERQEMRVLENLFEMDGDPLVKAGAVKDFLIVRSVNRIIRGHRAVSEVIVGQHDDHEIGL